MATSTRDAGLALIGLLVVSVAWGSSFPLTKQLLAELTPAQFLALRFVIAAVVLLALFHRRLAGLSRRQVTRGLGLGVLYGVATLVQTFGLQHTSATVSGFVTGMYVVLTPLCAWLILRSPAGIRAWVGAVLSAAGLGVLALRGFSLGVGELVTLVSALLYAIHIVGLGAWSTPRSALSLAVLQMSGCAVVCSLAAIPDGPALPRTGGAWVAVVYMALISGALAMFVQSWAQAQLAPSRAAVIMATEPVWAAALSIAFIGESLTWRVVVGGGTMLAAVVVVELGPRTAADLPRPEDLPKLTA